MSDVKDWNTKEIRAFKLAFGKRNDRSWFSSEPPHDPDAAYRQAREIVEKRREEAMLTWMGLADRHEKMPDDTLLKELASRADDLNYTTVQLMADNPPVDPDNATEALLRNADLWIAFQASCLSAANAMKKAGSGDKLRSNLNEQALELLDMVAPLRDLAGDGGPPIELQQVERRLLQMVATASDGEMIEDTLAFGEAVEDCRRQLQGLTKQIAASSKQSAAVYQLGIKQMYGIEVKPSSLFGFPYQDLLDTLAMVPPDHARNTAMTEVVGEYLGLSTGGDYLEGDKGDREGEKGGRIRINPVISLNVFGHPYQDPETGKTVRIDSWKATTLHEIGHAVDAAYGLMDNHGKDPGCGTWEKQNPLVYMQPQSQAFHEKLGRSGIADAAFTSRIDSDTFDAVLITVGVGNKKPEEMRDAIRQFWEGVYDSEHYPSSDAALLDERIKQANSAATFIVCSKLLELFPDGRLVADFNAARATFLQGEIPQYLAALTDEPPLVDPGAFWNRFRQLAEQPGTSADTATEWLDKTVQDLKGVHEQTKQTLKADTVARWTDAVIDSLPKPVNLSAYRAGASPWTKDLSEAMIGEHKASHEAYKGNTSWWRYGHTDRAGTFVSSYQWRAPGEWFAELYAITWFKKVEPPSGVADVLRPYFFGGHLTPDQMV